MPLGQSRDVHRLAQLFLIALVPGLLVPALASAEGFRFTPYLGYRGGGDFEDAVTGSTLDLDESESYGFILSKDTDDALEFIYTLQPTELSGGSGVSSDRLFDVDVMNFMVAGKNILNPETGGFVSGMVGVTHFDPRGTRLSSETRFAIGAGGGIDYRISDNLGFRLEGRGIATFLDSSGGVFCSSSQGCSAFVDSSVLLQFEALAGLSLRF
jgi:opacity protein-like surface antigen